MIKKLYSIVFTVIFTIFFSNAFAFVEKRDYSNGKVSIEYSNFDVSTKSKAEINRLKECGICPGIDGYLPDRETLKVEIDIKGNIIEIPEEIVKDLYNLHVGDTYVEEAFEVKETKDGLSIKLSGGDGAGAYKANYEVNIIDMKVTRYLNQHPNFEEPEIVRKDISFKNAEDTILIINPQIEENPDLRNKIIARSGRRAYKLKASSHLKSYKSITYSADNAHDLNLETAWVEGKKGYGIGEYIEFYFEKDIPAIKKIKIYNGYTKSKLSWNENSRVKKLRLYINSNPSAVLNLKDTMNLQIFNAESILDKIKENKFVLKFEILEAYKGLKYDDVAITEIFFN